MDFANSWMLFVGDKMQGVGHSAVINQFSCFIALQPLHEFSV